MDKTRIIPPGGGDDNMRTQALNADFGKTAMVGAYRALEMECIPGNKYALSTGHSVGHVLVQLKSPPNVQGRRLPLNLSLVVDRSGSMEGEPLNYVKQACSYVIDLLEPNDVLSVVTFEEQVEILVPARRVVNKALLKEHINRIEAGDTTNLYDGLVVGAQQVASVMAEGYVNRVLLLTDGEPTAGIKDFPSIVNQVSELKNRNVTITALGFGPDYNEELMAGIARRSGGNYYYITRPELIPEVFRRELESLMTIVARNLRVRLSYPRWVSVRQIFGRQMAHTGQRSVDVELVEMERGSAMSVLCELDFAPRPGGVYRTLKVDLSYDDAVTGRAELLQGESVFEFTSDRSLIESGENPIVRQEIEIAQTSRNLEKTVMGMKTQQISAMHATMELQKTMNLLASQGRTEEANQVKQAIDSIQRGGADAEKTLMGVQIKLDQGKR